MRPDLLLSSTRRPGWKNVNSGKVRHSGSFVKSPHGVMVSPTWVGGPWRVIGGRWAWDTAACTGRRMTPLRPIVEIGDIMDLSAAFDAAERWLIEMDAAETLAAGERAA